MSADLDPKSDNRVANGTLRSLSWGITAFLVIFIFGTLFAIGRAKHRAAQEAEFPKGLQKLVGGPAGEKAAREGAEEGFEAISTEGKLLSDMIAKGHDADEVRKYLTLLELGDTYVYDLNPEAALPYWQQVKSEFPEDLGAQDRIQLYQDFREENRARREKGELELPADELRERFQQRFAPS